MGRLSIAGLALAGAYAALWMATLGCTFLRCLGRYPDAVDAFGDPHSGLILIPLLPAFFAFELLGLPSSLSMPTYLAAMFATIVALYISGWLLGRLTAALVQRRARDRT